MKTCFLAFTFLASFFVTTIASAEVAYIYNPQTQFQVGDIKVTLLSEGASERKTDLLRDASPEDLQKYIPTGLYPTATNAFLVQTPERTMLIDTGFGRASFYSYLDNAGVKPEDIDVILLTHMHGDHIGGLLTNDGKIAFPNATIFVSEKEYTFWQGKKEGAVLENYGNRVKLFEPNELGAESLPLYEGIYPVAADGHTPGHTMYLIQSKGEKMMIWGDLVHAAAIQFPVPDVALSFDVDPVQAVKTRKEVFAYVSENRIPVAGAHLPLPAMGVVEKKQDSKEYRFSPF